MLLSSILTQVIDEIFTRNRQEFDTLRNARHGN